MIILRWITLGLLGCILGLVISLVRHPPARAAVHAQRMRRHVETQPLRVVDMTTATDPRSFLTMLVTDYYDHITAVDDVPVPNTVAGISYMQSHPPARGQYVDVTLANDRTHAQKRVLLLMH